MKLVMTVQEAIDLNVFEEVCNVKGIKDYALSEGLLDLSDKIELEDYEINKAHLSIKSWNICYKEAGK